MLIQSSSQHRLDPWFYRVLAVSVVVAGLFTLVPMGALVGSVFQPGESEYWSYFPTQELPRLLGQTLALSGGVWLLTLIMGFSTALVTTFMSSRGRTVMVILALLPLTIPSYVMGFIWFDLLTKLLTTAPWLKGLVDSLHGFGGLVWSMSLSLFPYVFIVARLVMQRFDMQLIEAARSLGRSHGYILRRIVLPPLIPALLAATFLVLADVLSDIGTVNVFTYETLTTAVYKAWYGFFSPHDALKIAVILVSLGGGVLLLVRWLGRDYRRIQTCSAQGDQGGVPWGISDFAGLFAAPHQPLFTWKSRSRYVSTGLVVMVLLCSSVVPLAALVYLASQATLSSTMIASLQSILGQTMGVATLVAVAVSVLSLAHLFYLRSLQMQRTADVRGGGLLRRCLVRLRHRCTALITLLIHLPIMGHAMPGAVMAVSLYVPLYYVSEWTGWPIITMMIALVIGLMLHFYGVAHQTMAAPYQTLPRAVDESALSLNRSRGSLLARVHLPLLMGPLLMSGVLVFMDVVKELPLTLMLRPLGWNTLAVKVYEWTSEGEWEKAAWPALGIVMLSGSCVLILAAVPKLVRFSGCILAPPLRFVLKS